MKLTQKAAVLLILCMMALSVKSQQHKPMNTTLTSKEKGLVTLASYAAKGDLLKLKVACITALDSGITVNEIREGLVHIYAYCGFPRSLRGLMTFMDVLKERKAKGINDTQGREASPVKDSRSKYERGKETLEKLSGVKEGGTKTGYAAFAPEIEAFLKEHLFADIFDRDILTYQERELVTVAVLSSIGGVEPMLRSHLGLCLNVGIKPGQLREFMSIIKNTVAPADAASAEAVLNEVLKEKA
ncbi:carboxymuconolactone decarboxylase family protein [Pedobacter sp. MC2016-14]|uniref:carboxymuconolactone decarboxylase family protein n=1 Tax=Pedobacter sp. MC2016-14 TaxID=2897327 RepID=UPI001E61A0E6|nr:carboxymuconolactone decarboxylase family protein [Pedobacter sp. MC2016-14]MCD0487773.1 carboxymuconolactone decarboxylase family protein [Pedobacter sp. MC2016-14]